jgi:hypothetical protein
MGNYVIAVGNYVIVSPSELGNYKIADSKDQSGSRICKPICKRDAAEQVETRETHAAEGDSGQAYAEASAQVRDRPRRRRRMSDAS